jgi:hypothetical protein
MPIQKTITLYTYAELSPRNWWLQCRDSNDFDFVVEDFERVCGIIGVELRHRTYRTVGGGSGTEPAVRWGLYSQGSGASFEGSYRYAKGAAKAIREYAPQDEKLHRIADRLQALQAAWGYRLTATMADGPGSNFYPHSGTMSVEVDFDRDVPQAREPQANETEAELVQLMRDLGDWLYRRIEEEDDYQTSDEYIADAMEANEYTFTEDGEREDA